MAPVTNMRYECVTPTPGRMIPSGCWGGQWAIPKQIFQWVRKAILSKVDREGAIGLVLAWKSRIE